jgi:hypothetical protein
MNIYFLSSNVDMNIGSYRVWINDLSEYFKDIGINTSINQLPDNLKRNEVIILGKSDIEKCTFYKKKYPNNLVGIINPEGNVLYDADFIIVGSIEEKDSLSKNQNVFIFPLIENKYRKIKQKIHSDNDEMVIGVHGSYTHLSKFSRNLKEALEQFSQERNIVLKVITNSDAPKWRFGKPNIPNIEIINWELSTFSNEILSCDIGIVPNISDIEPAFKEISNDRGLYRNDYFFRLKNKSNSGRVFVFIQHGIPVIADLTPSNLHILGNPDNGYAVFSMDGWLKAMREMASANKRKITAKNALNSFNSLYNPIKWVTKLANNIMEVDKYHSNN